MITITRAAARAAPALVAVATAASAATVRVPGDQPTIQAGIDVAAEGDTVLVAPGTYSGEGNFGVNFSMTTTPAPHNVVLLSEAGAEVTIIDVEGGPATPFRRGMVFRTGEGPESVVDGFTFINGYMSSGGDGDRARRHELSGGAMAFQNVGTSPTIRNCVFRDNVAFYSGGALEAEFAAAPLIESCVIVGNFSNDRGGGASAERMAGMTFRNCLIAGNYAAVAGGGLALSASTVVEGCTIAGNRSTQGGGLDVRYPATATVTSSVIWGNCADGTGDEVFLEMGNVVPILQLSCSIFDPSAADLQGVYEATDTIASDPYFCEPGDCATAPSTSGDYSLAENSRALSGNPCEVIIGATGAGCGPMTPVVSTSWSALRERFRPDGVSGR